MVFLFPLTFVLSFGIALSFQFLEYTEGIFFNFPMVQTMGCIAASILKLFRFF